MNPGRAGLLEKRFDGGDEPSHSAMKAEYALLLVGARNRNAELPDLQRSGGFQGRKQMDIGFVLVDDMVACHRRSENLSDGIHLCLGLRVICPLDRVPWSVVSEAQASESAVHC